MQERVTMNARGVITLPRRMRQALGLRPNDQLIIENTPQGLLLLRPMVSIPVELYTEHRIAEFTSDYAAISQLLDGTEPASDPA